MSSSGSRAEFPGWPCTVCVTLLLGTPSGGTKGRVSGPKWHSFKALEKPDLLAPEFLPLFPLGGVFKEISTVKTYQKAI